jgi:hypothetical protein
MVVERFDHFIDADISLVLIARETALPRIHAGRFAGPRSEKYASWSV